MSRSLYRKFIFEDYVFDQTTFQAEFKYSFDSSIYFTEKVDFSGSVTDFSKINTLALDRALELAFYVVGTSYFKASPTKEVVFRKASPDSFQANFLQTVYTDGLSQFYYENSLNKESMPHFYGDNEDKKYVDYVGEGVLALQSGGRDSLLLGTLLQERGVSFAPWYVKNSETSPSVINEWNIPLRTVRRYVDSDNLAKISDKGGLNGHVPVTYIVLSYALIDVILHGMSSVYTAIGAEGIEPHAYIGDMPVRHQWAKTWPAEQLFVDYVRNRVSPNIEVGSPIRGFSELRVAELFVDYCWERFGGRFSSCNQANYKQGIDNRDLTWCGECPKCANAYLLFSPFVDPVELQGMFNGEKLFQKNVLKETFKGLLGVGGVVKPFDCVGETGELRLAYHMAHARYGEDADSLSFAVPNSDFNYHQISEHQPTSISFYSELRGDI